MTKNEFVQLLLKVQAEERAVYEAGHSEYAHADSNAFRNFEGTSGDLNITREQVLWVFLKKHIDGIVAHINGHTSQREDVRGRIKDARMYLALLWGMLDDKEDWVINGATQMDYLESLEKKLQAPAADSHPDGWEYGADPLDEKKTEEVRDGHRLLPGPRYSDILVPEDGQQPLFNGLDT